MRMELPNKCYNIIYADPPWKFKCLSEKGQSRNSDNHYKCMELIDIYKLNVEKISSPNAILFMWVTYPFLDKGFEVIKRWGFKYKTVGFTWIKMNKRKNTPFLGTGFWTRANAEICLLATKGKIKRVSNNVPQVLYSRIEEHSKKPDEIRDRIVRLMGDIPRIELFARSQSAGWDTWGDQVPNHCQKLLTKEDA